MPGQRTLLSAIRSIEHQDFHRTSVERFVRSVAPRVSNGAVIVDAGAGEAWYKPFFAHAQYFAFDYAVGDAAWDYSHLDCICDLHSIPLRTASIPYILCTQTLEHIKMPQRVVDEFCRILKPGGSVFCTMPFIADAHHQEPHDFYRYTAYAAEYLFKSAGFDEVVVSPMGGYNTLMVSLFQKGVYRFVAMQARRGKAIRFIARILQKIMFQVSRWMNRLAWRQDQKDPQRYKFALGFTVIATKSS